MSRIFHLGTRKSPLAMAQSQEIARSLCAAHGWSESRIHLIPIDTKGDILLDQALSEVGGKGLFTQELENKLLSGDLDFAVHSLKDLPTRDPEGLCVAAIPPREDARDALILAPALKGIKNLEDLPPQTKFGTASLRRQAQSLRLNPDLDIGLLRGNVGTRIRRLTQSNENTDAIAATLLAMAGLKRLGLSERVDKIMPIDQMLPAPGQGALAVQTRKDDAELIELLKPLNCAITLAQITAEREFMARLDGSCKTPIAAYADVTEDRLTLTGRLLSVDGQICAEAEITGSVNDAAALGQRIAQDIRDNHPELIPVSDKLGG